MKELTVEVLSNRLTSNNESQKNSISPENKLKNTKRFLLVSIMFFLCIIATGGIIYFLITINNSIKNNTNPIYILPSSGNHTHTIIFMHGLDNIPENFIEMFNTSFNIKNKNTTKIVLLRAPEMKMSYNNLKQTSWFNIYSFPINSQNTYNFEDAKNSANYLKKIIDEESKILNNTYNKIFIGGHSQGACISLYTGYTVDYLLGGVIVCSGILFPQVKIFYEKEKLNVFLAHGDQDQAIPFEFHLETVKEISEYEGVKKYYYEGQGHAISEQEKNDMYKFLNETML